MRKYVAFIDAFKSMPEKCRIWWLSEKIYWVIYIGWEKS